MKAVRFHRFGGPEALRMENVPPPTSGPGQALARVAYCGVNHIDIWGRLGTLPVALGTVRLFVQMWISPETWYD